MSKAGVYKLTAPNGKCYIGQSIDIDKRFAQYKRLACKNQVHLHRALKKYGWMNFTFEILYSTESELEHLGVLLDTLEKSWIKKFDCIENGYNLMTGGTNGYRHSNETKAKQSEARKAYLAVPENLEALKESMVGRKKQTYTKERNAKISEALKLRVIPINQLDKDGNFIKTWTGGAVEVERELKIFRSNICKVLKGVRKTTGGFKWEYNNKEEEE